MLGACTEVARATSVVGCEGDLAPWVGLGCRVYHRGGPVHGGVADGPGPVAAHLLVLVAAPCSGSVPGTAGLVVAQGRATGGLGLLLVLPGLLAAVVSPLLAQDVVSPPPGADYVTAASQGPGFCSTWSWPCHCCSSPTAESPRRLGRWLFALILLDAAVFMVTAATAPGPFLPPDEATPHVLGTMPGAWRRS